MHDMRSGGNFTAREISSQSFHALCNERGVSRMISHSRPEVRITSTEFRVHRFLVVMHFSDLHHSVVVPGLPSAQSSCMAARCTTARCACMRLSGGEASKISLKVTLLYQIGGESHGPCERGRALRSRLRSTIAFCRKNAAHM